MKDQTRQLAATLREELKAKFQQKFQEPIKQLLEVIIVEVGATFDDP